MISREKFSMNISMRRKSTSSTSRKTNLKRKLRVSQGVSKGVTSHNQLSINPLIIIPIVLPIYTSPLD